MKIVGLTGGIGSGKTTVAKMFSAFGIPIYDSDVEAKKLTNTSAIIREQLTELLGKATYKEGVLDRKYMADKIFGNEQLLRKANAIIHPKVAEHFSNWVSQQNSKYVIKEAAILFESGSDAQCDFIILVTASKEERIRRVMERDQISKEQVEARIKNQWSDEKKMELSDFIIYNENLSDTKSQVELVHSLLI